MKGKSAHVCEVCSQSFKREDHLKRHRLSHNKAAFQCDHPGCGMSFHRHDVLKRRQQVHMPNPHVKRRRPRRGVDPIPFIRSQEDPSSHPVKSQSQSYEESQITSLLPTTPPVTPSLDDNVAIIPQDALKFCSLHFEHSCLRRSPFIHNTSLNRNDMPVPKLFAMAVLGAASIPHYQNVKKKFFDSAKSVLDDFHRHDMWSKVDTLTAEESAKALATDLHLVQAEILLIEYAVWSPGEDDQKWAMERALHFMDEVIPAMIKHVNCMKDEDSTWTAWIHREECIRSMWVFYSLMQKVKCSLTCSFSFVELKTTVPLPAADVVFDATDQDAWQQAIERSSMSISFPAASYLLFSNDANDLLALEKISCLAKHVLLASILDQYLSSLLIPLNFDSLEAYRNQELAGFKCRPDFLRALTNWRNLWWGDPAELLLKTSPPRVVDFLNTFFLNHLEILILAGKDDPSISNEDFMRAVDIACWNFYTVNRDGVLTVATVVAFLMDGASRYFVTGFARLLIRWANGIQGYQAAENLPKRDRGIYLSCCESIRMFAKAQWNPAVTLNLEDLQSFKEALLEVWAVALDNRDLSGDV